MVDWAVSPQVAQVFGSSHDHPEAGLRTATVERTGDPQRSNGEAKERGKNTLVVIDLLLVIFPYSAGKLRSGGASRYQQQGNLKVTGDQQHVAKLLVHPNGAFHKGKISKINS